MTKRTAARKLRSIDLDNWAQNNRKGCIICRNDAARDLVGKVIETQNRLHIKVKYSSVADLLSEHLGAQFKDNAIRDHVRRCIGGR
jgi:hypothetical protein